VDPSTGRERSSGDRATQRPQGAACCFASPDAWTPRSGCPGAVRRASAPPAIAGRHSPSPRYGRRRAHTHRPALARAYHRSAAEEGSAQLRITRGAVYARSSPNSRSGSAPRYGRTEGYRSRSLRPAAMAHKPLAGSASPRCLLPIPAGPANPSRPHAFPASADPRAGRPSRSPVRSVRSNQHPARSIRLPKTFSAAKQSPAISRAVRL
jgi:hypothetical protein